MYYGVQYNSRSYFCFCKLASDGGQSLECCVGSHCLVSASKYNSTATLLPYSPPAKAVLGEGVGRQGENLDRE